MAVAVGKCCYIREERSRAEHTHSERPRIRSSVSRAAELRPSLRNYRIFLFCVEVQSKPGGAVFCEVKECSLAAGNQPVTVC